MSRQSPYCTQQILSLEVISPLIYQAGFSGKLLQDDNVRITKNQKNTNTGIRSWLSCRIKIGSENTTTQMLYLSNV